MLYGKRKGKFKYIENPCQEVISWSNTDNPIGLLKIGEIIQSIFSGRLTPAFS